VNAMSNSGQTSNALGAGAETPAEIASTPYVITTIAFGLVTIGEDIRNWIRSKRRTYNLKPEDYNTPYEKNTPSYSNSTSNTNEVIDEKIIAKPKKTSNNITNHKKIRELQNSKDKKDSISKDSLIKKLSKKSKKQQNSMNQKELHYI
jgi:hypothetical protein